MCRHLTKQQQHKMSRKMLNSNSFNRDQRTSFWMRINRALEIYFQKENVPTDREMDFLAESLQLERKVVHLWFSNRRQKEKRKMWSDCELGGEIRLAKMLMTQSKKKTGSSQNGIDLFSFPLHFTGLASHFKRFRFGKPNPKMRTRTLIFMASENGLVHKKFINQIINFIVDVQFNDNFRFQLADEETTSYSNGISVYDIHYTEGFRIPFSLTIVVTPYSRDCEEQLFRDQKMAEMFSEFIEAEDGIQELDMICNVTVETGEISKQPFLSIFGKDVEKNINSWKLSVDFLSDNKGPWQAVVQHFFTVLATMKPKSLSSTKLVLDERKKMASMLNGLESLLTIAAVKMEEIKKIKKITKYSQRQIEYEIEHEIKQINYSYLIPNLSAASTITRFSPIPQDISNSRLRYENDIYKFYLEAEKKLKDIKSKGQYSVRKLQSELFLNGTAVLEHFQLTWRCIRQLNNMALHGNSFLTQKVFDLLFDAERHLKELGFNEQLENMKNTTT